MQSTLSLLKLGKVSVFGFNRSDYYDGILATGRHCLFLMSPYGNVISRLPVLNNDLELSLSKQQNIFPTFKTQPKMQCLHLTYVVK